MNRLEQRLARLEAAAGSSDPVASILSEVDLWHVDALLLQALALIGEATGELESEHPE